MTNPTPAMNADPYLCVVCGDRFSSRSFGGPGICPSCDCGISPIEKMLRAENHRLQAELIAATRERDDLKARLKEFDPDPVVCGCHEAVCPHTPIAKLSRQALVDHYKAHIKSLNDHIAAIADQEKKA
jgi:hypothetical protein